MTSPLAVKAATAAAMLAVGLAIFALAWATKDAKSEFVASQRAMAMKKCADRWAGWTWKEEGPAEARPEVQQGGR